MKRFAATHSLLFIGALALALTSGAFGRLPAAPRVAGDSTEANITRLTTTLFEHSQFAHHPLDDQLAGKLLDHYVDALDGGRSLFFQSDVDDVAGYRATLAKATRIAGDTTAARDIFDRYLLRLEQRVEYLTSLLRTATFDFTGHDAYSFDRKHAARPRDLAGAQQLWRQELRAEYLQEKLADKDPKTIAKSLTRRYAQQLRTMKGLSSDEVLEIYLNALAHVYDPHSDYLGHEQMESLSIAMNLSLFGIGASLETEDGYCKVRELLPGGPAARSGLLKPGDRIIAVAQGGKDPVDIVNLPLSRAVDMIRGQKGSTVVLTILPVGAGEASVSKTITLLRDEVKLEDQQAKARIVDFPDTKGTTLRLGIIDLPSFYANMGGTKGGGHRSATADVALLLNKLKAEHVHGVVLDLRRNGGGSLDEAISLTGLFIRRGPVVQTRGPTGDIEVGTDDDSAVHYDGPLVLLTSRFSASASEILAGALQDYGRAVIVGDSSTFGKGTVQTILPLARVMDQSGLAHAYDPGALKITIRKFYRPSGSSTQLRGVASDIVLPSTSDFADVSEASLADPLIWDTVPSASYEQLNRTRPYIATLRESSTRRVTAERDFEELESDIARLKKTLISKSVSLNEAERRQEKVADKARQDEREREKGTAQASRPIAYDITLKNAALPGLPPPVAAATTVKETTAHISKTTPDHLGGATTDRSPPSDITLNEAMHVLADYVRLLGPSNSLTNLKAKSSGV